LLENSSTLSLEDREHVDSVRKSAEDLQRIVTDVLDLSKLENGSMQLETVAFEPRAVAESSLDSISHLAAAKGIELRLDSSLADDPPHKLLGDPHRLKQCLLNLLGNAVRFTSSGFISVQWSICVQPGSDFRTLTYAVTDTGIGITEEGQEKLFIPFSQVDSSVHRRWGGTGLGLSITKKLATAMGGTAWCESKRDQGSVFSISVNVGDDLTEATDHRLAYSPSIAVPDAQDDGTLVRNLEAMNAKVSRRWDAQVGFGLPAFDFAMLDYASVLTGQVLFQRSLAIRASHSRFLRSRWYYRD
jgi:signal transduction histidine kinase